MTTAIIIAWGAAIGALVALFHRAEKHLQSMHDEAEGMTYEECAYYLGVSVGVAQVRADELEPPRTA